MVMFLSLSRSLRKSVVVVVVVVGVVGDDDNDDDDNDDDDKNSDSCDVSFSKILIRSNANFVKPLQ
jgi:hypothetical protein